MKKRQIDKVTKQVRIDVEIHRQLKVQAAKEEKSIKSFLEELLIELLGEESSKQVYPHK